MASILPKVKRQLTIKRTTKGKSNKFFLPGLFVLSLLLVTIAVPAVAQSPIDRVVLQALPAINSLASSCNLKQLSPCSTEVTQQPPTPAQLLQQGREFYQAGQFFKAANLWQQAVQAYENQGTILNQAQALNYLSLAYQDLGQGEQAQQAIATSLKLLQSWEKLEPRGVAILAQALNTQGSLQLTQGQTETALATWKQAEATYEIAGNETGKLGSRINQAQALQTLGQYRRANELLNKLVEELKAQPDSVLKADGLRSLGIALQTIGDLVKSKAILEQSLAISQQLNASADTSATLLGIGNIARDVQQYDVAWAYYQEAANLAQTPITSLQAQLNQLSLLAQTQQWQTASSLMPQIESKLSQLSPSRASIYARVNLAESLMQHRRRGDTETRRWRDGETRRQGDKVDIPNSQFPIPNSQFPIPHSPFPIPHSQEIAQSLVTAVQQARQIKDPRAEAYALTQLGKLYEQTQQWQDSRSLTEQALQISQGIEAADITARAAWQLGRILEQQGELTGAIAAFQGAFAHLQSLRSDLVAVSPDVQFNFKESVEPVYRELVNLLLQPTLTKGEIEDASQANLKQAREVIEALQLAELDNFFRDACLDAQPVVLDEIDTQAAVIYPIILHDSFRGNSASRLEVILSLPNQPLRHYATQLSQQEIEDVLQQFYSSLYPGYSRDGRLRLAEEVYDWLIRPAEADLANSGIQTLVFVPDGFLRNLPIAALYDGEQYLVEKYSIALSPGLQLFPQGLEREELKALTAGLTEARQGFAELPAVEEEVKEIASEVDAQVLLNQEFTRTAFQKEVNGKPFPVVHLATHGQFSSNPQETFLLTWDERISIKDFDVLFEKRRLGILKPIDLLVLSACQTAAGDKRATLGLAGFALRSGARSTMASLWSVHDESTAALMSEFYRQLTQTNRPITKAEALRQAQLTLLSDPQYNHPYFWASFVLVGNWL
ncbi:MAG: CHAT domain-containing protein [Symploca sp. SIO2G7]|nr:CHAT domain-containing protein [Symploca sp. SIO2G7]